MLSRFSTDVSVRSRLVVLSLIPVIGFAAIAFAYLSSERTVETAFGSVRQSSRLADASRAFKESLTIVQARAKDFVAQPQPGLIARFADAHDAASSMVEVVAAETTGVRLLHPLIDAGCVGAIELFAIV